MKFRYNMPTKLFFGKGCLESLHKESFPGKKALIVTSSGKSTKISGALDAVERQLERAGIKYCVYGGMGSNPSRDQVMSGLDIYRREACEFIVALGGGSVIDASKALAIVAGNGGDIWDYFHGGTAKAHPVKKPMAYLIAIPTTAGTGSEVDQWMVITDRSTGEKIGFGFSRSFPRSAYVDSNLMMTVPPLFTAYQGVDAMLHSIEAYLSKEANPLTDALALRSIGIVGKYLPIAVNHGDNEEAREMIALASTISGIILANVSMTAEHGMEDGLSGFFPRLPHGAGLIAISIEYFKTVIRKRHSEFRFVDIAKALGREYAKTSEDFLQAILELYEKCNVADIRLSDYGVDPSRFGEIVRSAKKNAPTEFAAEIKPLTDEECEYILNQSFK